MRSTEHETWTEYHWEKGDLVRLRRATSGHGVFQAKAGAWGVVGDDRDGYWLKLDLNGYSERHDGYGNGGSASRFDLIPWVREPADDEAIRRNVADALKTLSRPCGKVVARRDGRGVNLTVPTTGIMSSASITVTNPCLPDLLPHVGSGGASPDDLPDIDWRLNAIGHAFLDDLGWSGTESLAGGGNAFKLSRERRGAFVIEDLGTGIVHRITNPLADRLHRANARQVGMLHDGDMPDIARRSIPYPRTLRRDPATGLAVVETDKTGIEIRFRDRAPLGLDGPDATRTRSACRRIMDISKWILIRHEEEPVEDASPRP